LSQKTDAFEKESTKNLLIECGETGIPAACLSTLLARLEINNQGGSMSTKVVSVHAVMGFDKLADPTLLLLANGVLKALTGNAAFPTPTISLATFATDVTTFSNAATAALDGGKNAKSARDKAKKVLVTDLKQLAMYAQSNCNEEIAIFNTSGFTAKAKSSTSGPVGVPAIKSLDYGTVPGQILVSIKSTLGAKSYNLRFGQMPAASATGSSSTSPTAPSAGLPPSAAPAVWTFVQVGSIKKAFPLNNLVSGTVYAVQVQALGMEGLSAWSDSSTIMCT
jgi:hypothetical protein